MVIPIQSTFMLNGMKNSYNTITSIYTKVGVKSTDPNMIENKSIATFISLMGKCATELPCLNTAVVQEGPILTIHHQRMLIQKVTNK